MTPNQAPFPGLRFRRLRRTAALRDLAQEHRLSVKDLIWPVFVTDVPGADVEVPSMPGVVRRTVDGVARAAEEAATLGIPAICLFPYTDPALKTETCEEAWNPDNLSNRAVRAIKAAVPEVAVMTDVALDPYNALGHDGIVRDGVILNDETVEALVRMALLGFVYKVEFAQAVFLIAAPLTVVGLMSVATARRIAEEGDRGEALRRRLALHRVGVQVIGMISTFVTAFWGMLQNFNISILPG